MAEYYRSWVVIHLDAIINNIQRLREKTPAQTAVMAVVKADAYGHGSVPVARAVDPYVDAFAVAMLEEAILLRNHGIEKPIMILGMVPQQQYQTLLQYQIAPTIFQWERAQELSELAAQANVVCPIHIALDTGMSRIGLPPTPESVDLVIKISQLPGITIEGLFTHFARADESEKQFAHEQLQKFTWFCEALEHQGITAVFRHCSNSAGIIDIPEGHMDLVRMGISMYGCNPSAEMLDQTTALIPALEFKSRIIYLKELEAGIPVSYGGTFVTSRRTRVATVSIGYGDGYPRNQSGRGQVLIAGQRAAILGRVCMDQLMVDVTDIAQAKEGDEVTLIGCDGEEQITVEDLALLGSGFHYEILCNIGKRVPRVYKYKNSIIGTKDYFSERYADF